MDRACILVAWLSIAGICSFAAEPAASAPQVFGKLRRQANGSDQERYVLVDHFGMIRCEVVPADGIDLSALDGQEVALAGHTSFDAGSQAMVLHAEYAEPVAEGGSSNRQQSRGSRSAAPFYGRAAQYVDSGEGDVVTGPGPGWVPAKSQFSPSSDETSTDADWPELEQLDAQGAMEGEIYDDVGPWHDENCPGCETCDVVVCDVARTPWFISGDYLNMAPRRTAFDFALVDPDTDGAPEGAFALAEHERASGVQFGFGRRLYDGWELALDYSYLNSSDRQSTQAPAGGQLWTTLTHPNNVVLANSAQADVDFKYSVVDLELARRRDVGRSLEMRWFGGWRFAWIDQELDVLYNGGDANASLVSNPLNLTAYGLRAGARGDWRLNSCWSIFGEANGSLLVGTFDSRLTETDNAGADIVVDVTDRVTRGLPVLELGFGITRRVGPWRIQAGYRLAQWFDLVESPAFVDDLHAGKSSSRTSDLSLDGFFAGLALGL